MKILENPLSHNQENEIETPKISWFYDDSSDLIEIDLQTFEKTGHYWLSLPESNIDERICICPLPNNKLFCYGNTIGWADLSGVTFIINENYDIQTLPSGTPSLGCYGTYYKDSVYIFGLEFVQKFNLVKWRWEKLIKFPAGSRWCTSTFLNGMILATGYDCSDIFALDLLTLSFSSCNAFLFINQTRFLCNFEDSAYLIDFVGNILQSDKNNPFNWNIIGNFAPSEEGLVGHKAYYHTAWYFLMTNSQIYKFDLEEKKIKIINLPLTY